jgi:hypothetical protein
MAVVTIEASFAGSALGLTERVGARKRLMRETDEPSITDERSISDGPRGQRTHGPI